MTSARQLLGRGGGRAGDEEARGPLVVRGMSWGRCCQLLGLMGHCVAVSLQTLPWKAVWQLLEHRPLLLQLQCHQHHQHDQRRGGVLE